MLVFVSVYEIFDNCLVFCLDLTYCLKKEPDQKKDNKIYLEHKTDRVLFDS